jgi:hypothetical protein
LHCYLRADALKLSANRRLKHKHPRCSAKNLRGG